MKSVIIVKKVRNDFKKIAGATIQDAADSLYVEAESIMTASKNFYVPVVTGDLKNSGTVLKPEITETKVTVVLGYGGVAAPYAATVHEYPKSYGQKRNKYLTIPANLAIKNMSTRIAKDIQRRVNRRKNP